jgi:hypothetical protein
MMEDLCAALPRSLRRGAFSLIAVQGIGHVDPNTAITAPLCFRSLEAAAWRHGLEEFLRRFHEAVPADRAQRLDPDRLEEYLPIGLDPRNLARTRAVLEATLAPAAGMQGGAGDLSLAQVARAGQGPVEDPRKREVQLRNRVLTPMEELRLWDITWSRKAKLRPDHGATAYTGYKIRAGQALLWFYAEHYVPWYVEQIGRLASLVEARDSGLPPSTASILARTAIGRIGDGISAGLAH